MTQITRNQHFVPKFYLKRFARKSQIQVFVVRAKRILKARHYTSVCYEKFFCAAETGVKDEISQAFEEVFGQIEDIFAKLSPGIIERALALQLTNDDLDGLAYFMSVQWLRTGFFRERLQKVQSDVVKWMLKQRARFPGFQDRIRGAAEGREISDEQIDEVKRIFQSGEYSIRFDNSSHLRFVDEEKVNGFRNLLLAKRWRINLSEDPYRFITSPASVSVPCGAKRECGGDCSGTAWACRSRVVPNRTAAPSPRREYSLARVFPNALWILPAQGATATRQPQPLLERTLCVPIEETALNVTFHIGGHAAAGSAARHCRRSRRAWCFLVAFEPERSDRCGFRNSGRSGLAGTKRDLGFIATSVAGVSGQRS